MIVDVRKEKADFDDILIKDEVITRVQLQICMHNY